MKKQSYVTHLSGFRQLNSVLYKRYSYKSGIFKLLWANLLINPALKHKDEINTCTVKRDPYNAPSLRGKDDSSSHKTSASSV